MKVILKLVIGVLLFATQSRADSLTYKEISQELKQQSVLSLHQNVAGFWADNLLAAQDPLVCPYCANEPDSLQLSINSVLKAIRIEADPLYGAGLSFCDLVNCTIANAQSTIAIDDYASVILTPAYINFGEVPISTPEPSVAILCIFSLYLFALCLPKRSRRP